MKRLLTERQLRRFKLMSGSAGGLIMLSLLSERVAAAVRNQYEGPWYWQGSEYS